MQLRSWVLLSTLTAALTGCAEPVNDDDAVDDDAAASCDLAALADAVDPARLDDTLAWLTSYDRRDTLAVQDEILDGLAEQLEGAGAAVRYHEYEFQAATWRNLVATIPADASLAATEPHLVVGAHVDSTSEPAAPLAPGADDNASGVAAVLEAAAQLATCELPTRVDFVFFTNEEIGTVGSGFYAEDAADADEDIVAMIAVDMVAFGPDGEDLDLSTKSDMGWLAEGFKEGSDANTGTETVLRIDDHCG